MTPQLLDYIKNLTKNDTKNLSQKLGKTTEEVGELAKKILPFEDASGTLHRFTERSDILEESVDVMLTVLSIAYDLGFNDSEIEQMMWRKSNKWGDIQIKEQRVAGNPIPFEIHITVSIDEQDLESFKNACLELGIKPIIIELEIKQEQSIEIMTSSVHLGTNSSAYHETTRLSKELTYKGFNVIREKIETVPWHPQAPQNPIEFNQQSNHSECYFESHIAVIISEGLKEQVKRLFSELNGRMSRNPLKKVNNGLVKYMITMRMSTDRQTFDANLTKLKTELQNYANLMHNSYNNTFIIEKEVVEYAIYDSNLPHDQKWITQ